ncbi:MAG: isoleucine--tRNA ligase [Candidatus Magasanikbacteria bacterium]|nr:isoleucine--tRNA ligase [Candidatus Magasanikbacteria bacterium]
MPYNASENEHEILKYWQDHQVFEKSISQRPESKPYVFYDGPPFATGLPHYGHIVASLMKDVVPRYWTMQGMRVERRWGWDCHGLPIENIIEQDLGLKSRQDIEDMGIANFNEACRATVLRYAEEWKKTIARMGRWVDMEHDYKTMDVEYMESVWWVFKQLWDSGLIYEGKKPMHVCPRCVTPLSNFEVTQGYKDIKDLSITAKFKVQDTSYKQNSNLKSQISNDVELFILAWTTTPWTLPGNVLLAVGAELEYMLVKNESVYYICAKDRVSEVFKSKDSNEFELIAPLKGSDLVGLTYEPLFPYFANTQNAFRVVAGDFVTTQDGTGVVHIAPAYGDDDYQTGIREKTGLIQHVTMDGKFVAEVTDFAGMDVKPKDDPSHADVEIVKWLAHHDRLFAKEKYEHSYPHCWRCDSPLLNFATSSWFVRVTEMKDELLKNNQQTNWVPGHIKDGRFGLWLEGARDWAISRNRFWGTPLPVWKCMGIRNTNGTKLRNDECGEVVVAGSVTELEKLTGKEVTDLHKHIVDELTFECKKCGGEMRRITEVLDCWFESGSMPYGQMHYPFENKEKFEAGFPAEFIAEGQDQTRGWFYTLHVLATALTRGKSPSIPTPQSCPAFKHVIVNGIVLAEDGKKMSKRLKNYPDPLEVLEKYGADAMRYYLVSSPVMHAESLNFSEAGVREMYNKLINTLANVYSFYDMFADPAKRVRTGPSNSAGRRDLSVLESNNVLDKWILSKLQMLVQEVTEKMNAYKLAEASRPIVDFVTELSQWYVRRSRDRFKGDNVEDKHFARATLREVLLTLSKVMAPFTPFIAEKLYQDLGGEMESVHLETWPVVNEKFVNEEILTQMDSVRKIVEMGLSLRAEAGIKVRQPLGELSTFDFRLSTDLKSIIAEELNVKKVVDEHDAGDNWVIKEDGGFKVALDTTLTDELKKEGLVREIVRTINQIRKEQQMTIEDSVVVHYKTDDAELKSIFEDYIDEIKKSVLAQNLVEEKWDLDKSQTVMSKIDGRDVILSVHK